MALWKTIALFFITFSVFITDEHEISAWIKSCVVK